jgi:hypothetical protein
MGKGGGLTNGKGFVVCPMGKEWWSNQRVRGGGLMGKGWWFDQWGRGWWFDQWERAGGLTNGKGLVV